MFFFACPRASRQGFTLIELLVVVAIIALLMSILVPSLSTAREKGRVSKCLANLRQIMGTTQVYANDQNDRFPFPYRVTGTGSNPTIGSCSWSFGGKTSHPYWRTGSGGVHYWEAPQRPLNRYFRNGPLAANDPMSEFRCPSDFRSDARTMDDAGREIRISGYDDTGTSYNFSFQALYGTNLMPVGGPLREQEYRQLTDTFVRDVRAARSAVTIFIVENWLNWVLREQDPRPTQTAANHRQFQWHAAGFLDGHAVYRKFKIPGWCDTGWESINPNWIRIASFVKPIYYQSFSKNCNPR